MKEWKLFYGGRIKCPGLDADIPGEVAEQHD